MTEQETLITGCCLNKAKQEFDVNMCLCLCHRGGCRWCH